MSPRSRRMAERAQDSAQEWHPRLLCSALTCARLYSALQPRIAARTAGEA
jgi:hypothetical protein